MHKDELALYAVLGGIGIVLAVYVGKNAKNVGQAVGGAAVDLVDGVLSGGVIAAGDMVGVPMTNLTECERAKLEGRTWDASFACPAGDFLKYVFR